MVNSTGLKICGEGEWKLQKILGGGGGDDTELILSASIAPDSATDAKRKVFGDGASILKLETIP